MRTRFRRLGGITAALATAGVMWSAPALAQDETIITSFAGTATATSTWGRTIIDTSEPNGPGGGTIQAVFVVNVPYTIGMTAAQMATAYRAACIATLPTPMSNPNGYGVQRENSVLPSVRLGKQTGTFSYSDASLPPGITMNNFVPSNAQHAPAASPAGLMALAAGIFILAWRSRRRSVSA